MFTIVFGKCENPLESLLVLLDDSLDDPNDDPLDDLLDDLVDDLLNDKLINFKSHE